jgi:hypothetical protein
LTVPDQSFYGPRAPTTDATAARWAALRDSAVADVARAATYADTLGNRGKKDFYKSRATRKMRKFVALNYPLAADWATTEWAELDPSVWP